MGGKANFEKFLKDNQNCSRFKTVYAERLFNLMNEDENIILMAEYIAMKKPALAAVVNVVEAEFEKMVREDFGNSDFDEKTDFPVNLKRDFDRTVIGRMVKTILEPFGYVPTQNKLIPRGENSKYFSSASCYELVKEKAIMEIKKVIQPIQ